MVSHEHLPLLTMCRNDGFVQFSGAARNEGSIKNGMQNLFQERENPLILVHDKYSLLRLLEISIKVSLFIYVSAGDTL